MTYRDSSDRQMQRRRRSGKAYLWRAMHREPRSEHFPNASYVGGCFTAYAEVSPLPPFTAQYVRDAWYNEEYCHTALPVYNDSNVFYDRKPCEHTYKQSLVVPEVTLCKWCGMLLPRKRE